MRSRNSRRIACVQTLSCEDALRESENPIALRPTCCDDVPYAKTETRRASLRGGLIVIIWRCPTLEGPCGPTTIGADGLNCRVRDGNGWNPAAIGARNLIPMRPRAVAHSVAQRKAA